MNLKSIDKKLVDYYADLLTEPIKFGDNACMFWFPGSGKTSILKDLFENEEILAEKIGTLAGNLEIIYLWGYLAETKSLESLLKANDFESKAKLEQHVQTLVNKGKELLIILERIDNFPSEERLKILKLLVKLTSINKRRVNIQYHSTNKPWFTEQIKENPELLALANHVKVMPVLEGDTLDEYINDKLSVFNYEADSQEIERVKQCYGGVILLTKEYIRAAGSTKTLELKLKSIWDSLPDVYRRVLQAESNDLKAKTDLQQMGVLGLGFYKEHEPVLLLDTGKLVIKKLSVAEARVWAYLQDNPRQEIKKDTVGDLLVEGTKNDISYWAIDKAISRLRKKLAQCGIDPELLKTVKGKGYIWHGY